MGMFDYITCDYPLPGNASDEIKSWEFQTKDTPAQGLHRYRITADGWLEHKVVLRYEDRSDLGATGIMALSGCMTPVHGPWVKVTDYFGPLNFYGSNVVSTGPAVYTRDGEDSVWVEYEAQIEYGMVISIKEIEYRTEPAWKSRGIDNVPHNFETPEARMEWWNTKRAEFEAYKASELAKRGETNAR